MAKTRIKARSDTEMKLARQRRRTRVIHTWGWVAFFFLAIYTSILISRAFFSPPIKYELGRPIKQTIRAPFPLEVEDRERYNKEIQQRTEDSAKHIPHYYEYDSTVEERIHDLLRKIRDEIISGAFPENVPPDVLSRNLKRKHGLVLSEEATTPLLSIGYDRKFYSNLEFVVSDMMSKRGIIDGRYVFETYEREGLVKVVNAKQPPPSPIGSQRLVEYPEELKDAVWRSIMDYFEGSSPLQMKAAQELLVNLLEPNIRERPDLYQEERTKYINQIKKPKQFYKRGDIIISFGEQVRIIHDSALTRLNERIRTANLMQLLANFTLVLIIFGFVAFFVKKVRPTMAFSAANIILISLPVLLSLSIGRLIVQILGKEDLVIGYLFPAGVIGILGVMLLDARIAFFLVSWGALFFGLMMDMSFKVTLLALIGGAMSVSSLYNVRERKDMLMAGFSIALVNFISIIIFEFMDDPTGELYTYAARGLWGLGNGIACGIIAFPALVFFETFFGLVTDVKLLELTGIRQPLLSKMEEEAPGTYQHSLNVAKLAEPAAIAVDVNYLLVRTGAYYHDIGKIAKPKYYSENQTSLEDKKIYQTISPNMSVLIIKKHIKEGIEIAQKAKLPKEVIDFIPEHHGTSLIRYFYNQALKRAEESKSFDIIRKEDFRYPGPKPQSIETAIVMLADIVEATSTSKLSQSYVDEEEIRRIVHECVLNQFNDGQFDECDMTLRDLHLIEESFIKTLVSRYHHRVHYPSAPKTQAREEKNAEGENGIKTQINKPENDGRSQG